MSLRTFTKWNPIVSNTLCDLTDYTENLTFFEQIFKNVNDMRHVTIYTTDKDYNHFLELAKNLHYVKKIETDEDSASVDVLQNIKEGLQEVKRFNQGTLETTSAKDFLNEL